VRVLNFLANSGPLSQSNPTDVANVNQAQTILTAATSQLQQLTSSIGAQQSQLSDTLTAHQQSLSLAQSSIANITQVNSATVITELDALQTQMEASYQTVNILQNLTLANYLK
jgi:flagellin-like hook-associated protein FlgL